MARYTQLNLVIFSVTALYVFIYFSNTKVSSITNALFSSEYKNIRGIRILEDANNADDGGNADDYYVVDDGGNGGDDNVADDGGNNGDDNVADDGGNGGDDYVADDGEKVNDDFYDAGDDNGLDAYNDDETDNYVDDVDDEYTFNNRVKQKVVVYKNLAEEKFWEIYNNPPKDWTADQWGFFAALMTLLSVSICCWCAVCFKPCCSRNRDEKEDKFLSKEPTNSYATPRRHNLTNSSGDNHDPIMYSRSYDSQVV